MQYLFSGIATPSQLLSHEHFLCTCVALCVFLGPGVPCNCALWFYVSALYITELHVDYAHLLFNLSGSSTTSQYHVRCSDMLTCLWTIQNVMASVAGVSDTKLPGKDEV